MATPGSGLAAQQHIADLEIPALQGFLDCPLPEETHVGTFVLSPRAPILVRGQDVSRGSQTRFMNVGGADDFAKEVPVSWARRGPRTLNSRDANCQALSAPGAGSE